MSDQTLLIAGAGIGGRAQTAFIQRSALPTIEQGRKVRTFE
jgi:hypothetical protein